MGDRAVLKSSLPRLLLVPVLAFGCVFTSRPQLPIDDGGGASVDDAPNIGVDALFLDAPTPPPSDADRTADVVVFDAGIPTSNDAAADAPAPAIDATASPDVSTPVDGSTETNDCRAVVRSGDGGLDASDDAGFVDSRGNPCDPAAADAGRDATGAGDATDASDASDADARDATGAGDARPSSDASSDGPLLDAEPRG